MFHSHCLCRNKLSNPRYFTTVRQIELESYIRHTQGWLKLIMLHLSKLIKFVVQRCDTRRVVNVMLHGKRTRARRL